MLIWNILLAVAWSALKGDFTLGNLVGGFILGYILIALLSRRGIVDASDYVSRVPNAISLILFFLWELLLANLRLAKDSVSPKFTMKPGIIALPLDAKTDAEITVTALLITLTPGTLTMDVSDDRSIMYIHAMHIDDEDLDKIKRNLKDGFERRVMQVLR